MTNDFFGNRSSIENFESHSFRVFWRSLPRRECGKVLRWNREQKQLGKSIKRLLNSNKNEAWLNCKNPQCEYKTFKKFETILFQNILWGIGKWKTDFKAVQCPERDKSVMMHSFRKPDSFFFSKLLSWINTDSHESILFGRKAVEGELDEIKLAAGKTGTATAAVLSFDYLKAHYLDDIYSAILKEDISLDKRLG